MSTGGERVSLHGNHACALAAIAAGCRFFAGYPITPSSEVAERMSRELPKHDGVFIQMEDEIASMAAVIGASMGGSKVMTATSGPGFSLKMENLGYAAQAEVPCVIVNVMRGGPSTGMPTRPAQGDFMQSRWGSHGDYPIIVLTPASVAEVYHQTIRAFNLAERLRVPVVLLYDQIIAHLLESVELPREGDVERVDRKWADTERETYLPYADPGDGVPVMPRPGDGYRCHTTGLTHAENGFPTQDPATVTRNALRLLGKLERHRDLVDEWEELCCEDAELLVVAVGIASRAARRAVLNARRRGVRAGLFRPVSLWPFPERQYRELAGRARRVIVAEMNTGQLLHEIERLSPDRLRPEHISRIDGESITPAQIEAVLEGGAP